MSAVYALYSTADTAQRAVNNLRAAGVDEAQITIISSEPFEEHEFAQRDKATAMGWIALGGAILGLLSAAWLTRMTELAWPLPTGNMPIVAWWPNMIVISASATPAARRLLTARCAASGVGYRP